MKQSATGIDTHAHIFHQKLAFISHRRYTPAYDALLDTYFGHLHSIGFSHGVLVQPSFLGTDNHYLLSALATAPERLRGVVVISPDTPINELQEMAAAGVVGARLNLVGQPNPPPGDPALRRLLETLATLNWHIELHQHQALLPDLVRQITPFEIPIVLDHVGRPQACGGIMHPDFKAMLALATNNMLWVKFSGLYRLGDLPETNLAFARQALPVLLDTFGPHRLLLGSDWPHTQYENRVGFKPVMEELLVLVTSSGLTETLSIDNASKLYQFSR